MCIVGVNAGSKYLLLPVLFNYNIQRMPVLVWLY